MKKKTTLAFSELAETLAVFDKKELSAIKGGLADASVEWQEDSNGNLYYRNGSNDSWHEYSITLDTVNITGNGGGSNSSSAGISYGYGWGSSASGMGNSGYGGSDGSGSNSSNSISQAFQNLGILSDEMELAAHGMNNLAAVKAFGAMSKVAAAGGLVIDSNALYDHYINNQGNMDGFRFSIKTGGTAISIISASAVGGAPGVVVGSMVAGGTVGIEYSYDVALETLTRIWGQFTNQYGNGGLPQS